MRRLVGGLVGCTLALGGQAGIYKWTDAQGRVHFGDRPGAGQSEEVRLPASHGTSPPGASQKERQQRRQKMLDVYRQERAEKRAAAQKARQQRKERKKRCLAARADYDSYNTAGAIYNYTEEGGRDYFNKQQRADYIAKLKAEVRRWCGK